MGTGLIKLKCVCGHIMDAITANFLNEMECISHWKCSKCKQIYKVKIEIKKISRYKTEKWGDVY